MSERQQPNQMTTTKSQAPDLGQALNECVRREGNLFARCLTIVEIKQIINI